MSQSPSEVIPLLGQIAKYKISHGIPKNLLKGFYAGAYLSFGGLLSLLVAGGVYEDPIFPQGLLRVLAGLVFPIGLMMIILSGMELFTSNVMYMMIGLHSKKVHLKDLALSWLLVYLSNLIGSLFVAFLLVYKCSLLETSHTKYLLALTDKKIASNFFSVIFKGIGCNWLVCLAVYHSFLSKDIASKLISMHFPIWVFVTVGFEHSIANMFYFPLAMMYGSSISVGEFIVNNLLPVTLGNLIGGGLFMGSFYFYLFYDEKENDKKNEDVLPTADSK